MTKSKIEWTDEVWNPTTGCNKVSPGCKNCYAEREWIRLSANPKTVYYGRDFKDVQCHPDRLDVPLQWRKPRRVFVNSMSDLFHEDVPFDFISAIFGVMAATPQHTYQILTKRPDRMLEWFNVVEIELSGRFKLPSIIHHAACIMDSDQMFRIANDAAGLNLWPLPNVLLGVSVEDQPTANERIPVLLRTPAAVRFLSCEPLISEVILTKWLPDEWSGLASFDAPYGDTPPINWVVVGGESGPKARPMHPQWAQDIRDQCVAAGVPFFFKQWGSWMPVDLAASKGVTDWMIVDSGGGVDIPDNRAPANGEAAMRKTNKKKAGNLLDGKLWKQYP